MAKISKPDANPVVSLLLTLFLFESGHVIVNGQKKKWLLLFLTTIVLYCCIVGIVIWVLSVIDAYKTSLKLKAGKEIDENEYSVELLYKIMKIIHKDAVFVA